MMKKYLTIDEYNALNEYAQSHYEPQYQEYTYHQPGAEQWTDISETKSFYSSNPIQKVYRLKDNI